jgi:hypothetical protein
VRFCGMSPISSDIVPVRCAMSYLPPFSPDDGEL